LGNVSGPLKRGKKPQNPAGKGVGGEGGGKGSSFLCQVYVSWDTVFANTLALAWSETEK